jgi:hypothetical protein
VILTHRPRRCARTRAGRLPGRQARSRARTRSPPRFARRTRSWRYTLRLSGLSARATASSPAPATT